MAAAAVGAELAIVDIISPVTVATAAAELLHVPQRLAVAGVAGNGVVRAVKREICQRVMVELPGLPVDGIVAVGTVAGIASVVWIFLGVTIDACTRGVTKAVRFVAGLAFRLSVSAKQREAGQVVVEEYVLFPGGLVVTVQALDALFPVMRIVFSMTVVTAGSDRYVEDRLHMAAFTVERLVGAEERVIRVPLVVEGDFSPELCRMAGLTLRAEVPVMLVLFQVARDTRRVESIRERFIRVTVTAGQLAVPAVEGESRIPGVIETRIRPRRRVVAAVTLVAAASVVHVVVGMAADTGGRRILERLVDVAVRTGGFPMSPDQGIVRGLVIELDLEPA